MSEMSSLYRGYEYNIFQSDIDYNPREWDNLGIMLCLHNRYRLGDDLGLNPNDFDDWTDVWSYIKEQGGIHIHDLYLLDHGLLTVSMGEFSGLPQGYKRFDTGQIGFIYTTRKRVIETLGVVRITKRVDEKIEQTLAKEIENYNYYLHGLVYETVISNPITGKIYRGPFITFGSTDKAEKLAKTEIDQLWEDYKNSTNKYQEYAI